MIYALLAETNISMNDLIISLKKKFARIPVR